ncbi:MAG: aminomethyl-transferring glycine dehydrogenase subunit GcvPA [Thermoplasmata archaeon]|nr:MAG: aminomethyl-transferring glycine dehydrogenase subunit GcvPA [Thermoplasmata archaeon]
MNFVPNTKKEREEMMDFLGISSITELFEDVDAGIRNKDDLKLPEPMSEIEIIDYLGELSSSNHNMQDFACFLGAGAYYHFIPSVVDHLLLRGEFYTSYTPYQAEMSQGMLQSIFEFQSMICELTGMDAANASMYDGASALSEAAILAAKYTEKKSIMISKAVHPEYRHVLKTYANAFGLKILETEMENGLSDIKDIKTKLNDSCACVIVQFPNFFGNIEELKEIGDLAHKNDSIFVTNVVEPISLGLLKPPGAFGADVVVGEAQALGNPLNYGGPHLGFMATKEEFLKKIPGRISGLTLDTSGERGFILTLQTREQHIRRERATSNICTNQALNALAATIYLAVMGKHGLKEAAEICYQRAHYASKKISDVKGFEMRFSVPFFNEFLIECPKSPKEINRTLLSKNILGGFEVGKYYEEMENCMLLCVTEMNTKSQIDELVNAIAEGLP